MTKRLLKEAYLYQTQKNIKVLVISTIVYVIISMLVIISMIIENNGDNVYMSGMDFVFVIIAFVLGCSTFKEDFTMHLQNGVSRATYFKAKLTATLSLGALSSLLYTVITFLMRADVFARGHNLDSTGIFEQMYLHHPAESFMQYLLMFCLLGAVCTAFHIMGTLFGCFFYRVSKVIKIITIAVIIAAFQIGVPAMFVLYDDGSTVMSAVFKFLYNVFFMGFGLGNGLHWLGVSSSLLTFALLAGVLWLLLRRTPLKTK